MAKIHDLFIVELAEVIKGYGNSPDVEDPFSLSAFYRFYELPNIAVSRENFEKMRPIEPQRMRGRWVGVDSDGYADGNPVYYTWKCSVCNCLVEDEEPTWNYCPNCGARMSEGEEDE